MTKSFKFQIKKEQEWGEKALRVLGEKASDLPGGEFSTRKPVISGANPISELGF